MIDLRIFFLGSLLLLAGCQSQQAMVGSSCEVRDYLDDLNVSVNSTQEAQSLMEDWLQEQTNYEQGRHYIMTVESYDGFYCIEPSVLVSIHRRVEEQHPMTTIGFRTYTLTTEGKIYGGCMY